MKSTKSLFVLLGVCAALFAAAWIASPYYALWKIQNAYDQGDYAFVAAQVDYPSLRSDINQQLQRRFEAQLTDKSGALALLFALGGEQGEDLATLFAQGMDAATAEAINPESVERALAGNMDDVEPLFVFWSVASGYLDFERILREAFLGADANALIASQQARIEQKFEQRFPGVFVDSKPYHSGRYCAWDCFETGLRNGEDFVGVRLQRTSLFGWRIAYAALP